MTEILANGGVAEVTKGGSVGSTEDRSYSRQSMEGKGAKRVLMHSWG